MTMRVQLTCARVGHRYNSEGQFIGDFSQAAGQVVEMPKAEAERYIERGLATLPTPDKK
jgi:hypothetical protein